jgi:hypothetical protein
MFIREIFCRVLGSLPAERVAQLREWLRGNGPPAACVLLIIVAQKGCVEPLQFRAKAAQCKQNLHAVQLALERFAVDKEGAYPVSIGEMQQAGYMPKLPLNPFTGEPMQARHEGEEVPLGDFLYYPRYDGADNEPPTGYTLAAGNTEQAYSWIEKDRERRLALERGL